jgi:hypothetical protein
MTVDRLHDLTVAAPPEHFEQLVTVRDQVSHAGIVRVGFGCPCSGSGPAER